MKIWLDDQLDDPETPDRHPPEGWVGCKVASEAIRLISTGAVTDIDYDHDLGDDASSGDGYQVALYIEEGAYLGTLNPIRWHIHSANPVGREKIKSAMRNADRYWRCSGAGWAAKNC